MYKEVAKEVLGSLKFKSKGFEIGLGKNQARTHNIISYNITQGQKYLFGAKGLKTTVYSHLMKG